MQRTEITNLITWKDNIEGVKHIYIADFLLMDKWE